MKPSPIRTLLIGLSAGVAYAFIALLIMTKAEQNVSISYIFILPIILGAIPALFSTHEQLKSYLTYLLLPWLIVLSFFTLSFVAGFEGMICLVIIIGPFMLLGSLGMFIVRYLRLKTEGLSSKLYISLTLPFLMLLVESNMTVTDEFHTVTTTIEIDAPKAVVWQNLKNVKDIQPDEVDTRFIHLIGIPKPLDGRLDTAAVGGTRHITWEKGIRFEEKITSWDEGDSFGYDIHVNPNAIPSTTLDEHVMIGGKYFDVVKGGYSLEAISLSKTRVTLHCTYRVSTNLNFYSKWWADLVLEDFNDMILEVIEKRSQARKFNLPTQMEKP